MRVLWWLIGGGGTLAALGLAAVAIGGGEGSAPVSAGNPGERRIALMNSLKDAPRDFETRRKLAETFLKLADGVGAEAEIRRAMADGLPRARGAHILAHALLLQDDPRDAIAAADTPGMARADAVYAARIRGRAQMALEDQDAAAVEFNRALALAPNDSIVWSDIGRFRMLTGDMAGAGTAADKAVAIDRNNIEALILKGELVRGQYGLVGALPWFERVLAIEPQNVSAMIEAAATLGDMGRTRDMLAMSRRILAVDSRNPQAFFLQATLAARAGKYQLARRLMQRVDDRLQDLPAVILLAGSLDYQAGNIEQAIDRLEKLVLLQPDNIKARRLLGAAMLRSGDAQGAIRTLQPLADRPDADSYTLTVIGRAFEAAGDRSSAAVYLQRAANPVIAQGSPFNPQEDLTMLARSVAEQPDNARTVIPLIRGLIESGDAQGALDQAQKLQRENPGAPAAHVLVGDSLGALGRYAEAAENYRRAANINFSEPVALRMIDALARAGNEAAATKVLNLYLSQNPRSVPALLIAARRFGAAGDWPRVIAILEGLRQRLGNQDVSILNNLAWAYYEAGNLGAALPLAERAYALSPSNPAVTDSYGWIAFKQGGDPARAVALLEKAVALAPDEPGLHWHLAQAYAATGRRAEAKRSVRAVLAHPDYAERPAAEALLKRL